jgi:phenylacetate-CoA ligase
LNRFLLRAYHRLPGWVRTTAASGYGLWLRGQRYGAETERLVEEAMEREYWSPRQWRNWREERLGFVLHKAATRVPYYRLHGSQRRRHGDRRSWEYLENWPILEGEALRAQPEAFLAEGCARHWMVRDHTSGTSGRPLRLWRSRRTLRARYALYESRHRLWYGVSRRDRWAMAGGQLVVPFRRRKPPFWVWNAALKQLYVSSYHLGEDFCRAILHPLERYEVRYLWGYPSSLSALAEAALETGVSLTMRVAVANAEPVFPRQRLLVERAFGCPLRETYGMVEMVAAAGECEFGNLHVWPEVGWVEILEAGAPVAAGESGELICTSLLDDEMPLIRYRLGDRAAWGGSACPCGRRLPVFSHIEGRSDDTLHTRDGRRIGRLDPVFKADLPVREAQIVQTALDHVRVLYVPAPGAAQAVRHEIRNAIEDRMGPIRIDFEEVEHIPRGPNGKFRAVVCELPQPRPAAPGPQEENLSHSLVVRS